jgi:hypothetical protein
MIVKVALGLLCLLIIFVFICLFWCALALGVMADRRTYKEKD